MSTLEHVRFLVFTARAGQRVRDGLSAFFLFAWWFPSTGLCGYRQRRL